MVFGFRRKAVDSISDRAWQETLAFYQHGQHVSQIKHGTILHPKTNPQDHPGVTQEDWMAIGQYDLMADIVRTAGAERIEDVTGPYRIFLHLIAVTAVADDAGFAAAMAQAPAGMAEQLRPIRAGWAKARLAPVPRALPGESGKMLLARLNRGKTVSTAYALGLAQLRSGSFVDNTTQHFLLPYAVQRYRAVAAQTFGHWQTAPEFTALTRPERAGVEVMLRALCAGEDELDLMTEFTDMLPNGDTVAERIYVFQSASVHLALQDSVTADLPKGAPGPFLDAMLNPFDTGLYLLAAAMAFHAGARG